MPKTTGRGKTGKRRTTAGKAREAEILRALDTLSPSGRKAAIRRLSADAEFWERIHAENLPRMQALARERGLDWDRLSDDEREALVDRILHET